MKNENAPINDNLVIGRNAVLELLKSNREIENVMIAKRPFHYENRTYFA